MKKRPATDWLASESLFYNTKTLKISKNINEVIDFEHFDWDADGLCNYLDFGYVVFGKTPVKYVHFMRPNAELVLKNNQLVEEVNQQKETLIFEQLEVPTQSEKVIDQMISNIQTWEAQKNTPIVCPLSGGLDSRFLVHAISNKQSLKCFTYDSYEQHEINKAQMLTDIKKVHWQSIHLQNNINYLSAWCDLFGVSSHAHGMHMFNFFTIIEQTLHLKADKRLISGLIGDAWSGAVNIDKIESPQDIARLCLTHGLRADSRFCKIQNKKNLYNIQFFEENRQKLLNHRYRVIETMRNKIMLLKYLLNVPQTFNYETYAPFIQQEISLNMLRLPDKQRNNRAWQREFFKKVDLDIEQKYQPTSSVPYRKVSLQGIVKQLQHKRYKPLNPKLLGEIIDEKYTRWVNNEILMSPLKKISNKAIIWGMDKKIIWRFASKSQLFEAFYAYLTLMPLQKLIQQRQKYFNN